MSLLSDFLKKPYPGFSKPSVDVITFAGVDTEFQLTASDAAVTGINSPTMRMTGTYSAVGSGPQVIMEGLDNAAGNRQLAVLKSAFVNNAAATVHSSLTLTVLNTGVAKSMKLDGNALALTPSVAGQLAMGSTTLPWSSLFLGDGTAVVKVDGAAATNSIGTTTAHTFSLVTQGTARLAIGIAGQVAINAGVTPDTLSLLRVTGTHPNGASTILYAHRADVTFPATATSAAYSYYSNPQTPNTAFTLPTLAHFEATNANKGAASTITNQYGFKCEDQTVGTNNYGFHGSVTSGTNKYNAYMVGTAPNFFAGETSIGVVGSGRNLNVETATAAQPIAHFRNTNAAVTADVVTIFGQNSSSSYNALKVTNAAAASYLLVRGDGQVMINTNTPLLVPAYGTVLQVNGAIAQAINTTFNGGVSYGYYISGSLVVPAGNAWYHNYLSVTATFGGVGGVAYYQYLTISATTAATNSIIGVRYSGVDSGAGVTKAAFYEAQGSGAHTGTLFGADVAMLPTLTSASVTGMRVGSVAGAGNGVLNYAYAVDSTTAGSSVQYGLYVANSSLLTGAAMYWAQRAASTANFLQMVDSGAATRFLVDVNGDMTLGGTVRRIKADMDNGTRSNRLHFIGTTVNGTSTLGILPNGTATTSEVVAYNTNTPDAASYLSVGALTAEMRVNSANAGGTTKLMNLSIDGTYALQIATNRDVLLGPAGAVTGMTAGFPYLPAAAGTASGTPTARTGYVPFYYDTTNNKIMVYNGAWKSTVALT